MEPPGQEEDGGNNPVKIFRISKELPALITSSSYFHAQDGTHPSHLPPSQTSERITVPSSQHSTHPSHPPPSQTSKRITVPSSQHSDWHSCTSQEWSPNATDAPMPPRPTPMASTPESMVGLALPAGYHSLSSMSSMNNRQALDSMASFNSTDRGDERRHLDWTASFASSASGSSDRAHLVYDHSPADESPTHSSSTHTSQTSNILAQAVDQPDSRGADQPDSRGANVTSHESSSSSMPGENPPSGSPFQNVASWQQAGGNGAAGPSNQYTHVPYLGPNQGVAGSGRLDRQSNPFQDMIDGVGRVELHEGASTNMDPVGPSPFADGRVALIMENPSLTTNSIIQGILPAKLESGNLSARPSLSLQERHSSSSNVQPKKLRSTAMKVPNQWIWDSALNTITLCCHAEHDTEFLLLASKKNELLVYNWRQKSNAVQVLTSDVRTVTHHDNTFWVGLANGTIEVERKGKKVSLEVFDCAVSCIAVGPDGIGWVASEKGQLQVLELHRNGDQFLQYLDVAESTKHVTAMCHVGRHMVVARGEGDAAEIQLWRNHIVERKELLDTVLSGPQHKTCTCITSTIWRDKRGARSSRILTGHSKGHLLLWKGHELGQLALLAIIDASLSHHSVRGLAALPSVNALCIGAGNYVYFTELPTAKDMDGVPTTSVWWKPGKQPKKVLAHRTGIKLMASTHGHVVTCSSQGTVRLWESQHIIKFLTEVGIMAKDIQTYVPEAVQRQLQQNGQLIPSSELQFIRCIGAGAYGEVHQALWKGIHVAVKQARRDNHSHSRSHNDSMPVDGWLDNGSAGGMSDMRRGDTGASAREQLRELQREVQQLASVVHVNVVTLLGVVVDDVKNPQIVTAYYPGGNVYDLIQRAVKGTEQLPWWRRLNMLHDVAAGMLYLHTKEPHPVVHGDLRSPNLLLDLQGSVKIADFGSSRILVDNKANMSKMSCNPRWCAPEKLNSSQDTAAADVYSFAMIMWELMTLKVPFYDTPNEWTVYSIVINGGRPQLPPGFFDPHVPSGYKELLERCWSPVASQRPMFEEILQCVKSMMKEVMPPNGMRSASGRSHHSSMPSF